MNSMRRRGMTWILLVAGCVQMGTWTSGTVRAGSLEIRVAPSGRVFLNDSARRIGIRDVMLQNIAVINAGEEEVELQQMRITAFRYGQPILTERIHFDHYQLRWKGLHEYFTSPGTLQSQDSIYLFSELLGGGEETGKAGSGIALSPDMSLAPGTAVMLGKRLLTFSDHQRPDRLRLEAFAVSKNGRSHTAAMELEIDEYETLNDYILPVKGRWYLAAASSARSHHRIRPAHEFALDLIKISGDGSSFRGDGTKPRNYFAYGEEVVAAADGTVIRAVNSIPDTEMPLKGESRKDFAVRVLDAMWAKDPSGRTAEGNLVILEHAGGEHTVYVHLQPGSVSVKAGDIVSQGQVIGRVGISGDGFQPHLHFQINAGPEPQFSRGLPARFLNVRPVPYSSTLDMKENRLYLAGEFIETISSRR